MPVLGKDRVEQKLSTGLGVGIVIIDEMLRYNVVHQSNDI